MLLRKKFHGVKFGRVVDANRALKYVKYHNVIIHMLTHLPSNTENM